MPGCHSLLLPGVPLFGKILAFDFVGSFGSRGISRLYVDHTPGIRLGHTGPWDSYLCVYPLGHSYRVVGQYIYRRVHVGYGRLSGIDPPPGPDCCAVLCVGLVQPADLASCTRSGPLYVPESCRSYTVCVKCSRPLSGPN